MLEFDDIIKIENIKLTEKEVKMTGDQFLNKKCDEFREDIIMFFEYYLERKKNSH